MTTIVRICLLLLLALMGCQANPTVTDQSASGLEPTKRLSITFTNQWAGSVGPPQLREFGLTFLDGISNALASKSVAVDPFYSTSGGRVSSRYFLQVFPVPSMGHRPGNLCIRVELVDTARSLKPVWSAWIWVPPLDKSELASPSKGWGKESAEFLVREMATNLERIGLLPI